MNKVDIYKILHYQVPPKILNIFGRVVLFFLSGFLFVCNAEAIAIVDDSMKPFTFWVTTSYGVSAYITLVIVFAIFYCLSGKLFFSYVLLEIITICWGIANRVVFF